MFFALFHENQSKVLGYKEWVEILMIMYLSFQPKIPQPKHLPKTFGCIVMTPSLGSLFHPNYFEFDILIWKLHNLS